MSSSEASDTAIHAKGLGKVYKLGQLRGADMFTEAAGLIGRRIINSMIRRDSVTTTTGRDSGKRSPFWALKDANLDVGWGEVVGIIGPNGAGKTTLLKILARVTEPTRGMAEIYGRVGSLLEIGLGFHGDLTGRENIFLSGTILGMRKKEINSRFEEIVAFSGVEEFLDTPVKRYSSGMQARLGFAVAAHLEPDVLLVDEVLAVGDIGFQKKCIGRMSEVAGEGRTVLFVSHNMAYVRALCARGILLDHGSIVMDSSIDAVVDAYLRSAQQGISEDLTTRLDRSGTGEARLTHVEVSAAERGKYGAPITAGGPMWISFKVDHVIRGMGCDFAIYDMLGGPVANFTSGLNGPDDSVGSAGESTFECHLQELLLQPGRYRVDAWIWSRSDTLDRIEGAAHFDVEEGLVHGRPIPSNTRPGKAVIPHRWTRPMSAI